MPKWFTQQDLNKIPVKGIVPEASATAPANPVEGQLWTDSSVNKLKVYEGGAWVEVTKDTNTTYSAGSQAELTTGTVTTVRVWSPKILKDSILAISPAPPVTSVAGKTGAVTLAKGDVGLGNVDNTADSAKPVSTPQQNALNLKANLNSPTFTGTVGGITKAMVGLSNVDNTADSAKPVSTAQQNALNLKANLNSPTFTGTVIVPTPLHDSAAATKGYVDQAVQGLDAKQSVRAATTANITLSGTQTIDGVTLSVGDRVLVKNQTTAAQNGIYQVASGAWVRTPDFNDWSDVPGAFVFVEGGSALSATGWVAYVVNPTAGTMGTTAILWYQFSSAGVIEAGSGLSKAGNTISIANLGVSTGMLANLSVTEAKLANDSVGYTKLKDGAVGTAKLDGSSVTSEKLANLAVGTSKIEEEAVTGGKLANNAVSNSKISNSAVNGPKIADLAVTQAKIADLAVTENKIGFGAVSSGRLADGAVDLPSDKVTGVLPISKGGTGGSTKAAARAALNAASYTEVSLPALSAGSWVDVPNDGQFTNTILSMPIVQFNEAASGEVVYLDARKSGGKLQVKSDIAVAANAISITIIGGAFQGF